MYRPFFFLRSTSRSAITMGLPLESQHSHLIPSPLLVVLQKQDTDFAFLPSLAIYFLHSANEENLASTISTFLCATPIVQVQSLPSFRFLVAPTPFISLTGDTFLHTQLTSLTFRIFLAIFSYLRLRGMMATVVEGISLIPLFPIIRQTQSFPAKTFPPAFLVVLQVQLMTLTFFNRFVLAIFSLTSPRGMMKISG